MRNRILLATRNEGKVREYRSLLKDIPFQLLTPADVGIAADVEEMGGSYRENASLKAEALAAKSGILSLADDSGLEVDALGGEPGLMSARYAGEGASDRDRVDYLLVKLEGVPMDERTACFKCVIAVAAPDGRVEFCSGECLGIIALHPVGEGGFGYDPVFYLPRLDKVMAELPLEVKNDISHRGQAAKKVPQALERLGYDWTV